MKWKKSCRNSGSELNLWTAPEACVFPFYVLPEKWPRALCRTTESHPIFLDKYVSEAVLQKIVKAMLKGSLASKNLSLSKQNGLKLYVSTISVLYLRWVNSAFFLFFLFSNTEWLFHVACIWLKIISFTVGP